MATAIRGKKNFTEGPIFFRLLLFTIPIILTGLLQITYNMADNIVVGNFSGDSQALAAVGQTGTYNSFVVNLILGLSTGAGVVVAQAFGANRKEDLSRAIHTSVLLSVIMGVFFLIVGLLVTRPILAFIVKPELLDKSVLYMTVICFGFPASSVYNFGASALRSLGDSKRPLIILGLSGLINVGLNLIFVIAFHMSIVGVALATIASQYASAIAVIVLLFKSKDDSSRVSFSKLKIDRRSLKRILYCGIPAAVQSSIFSFANMILTRSISTFPVETVTANTIAGNIDGITYTCMNSFTAAALTFSGQNYGAVKKKRLLKVFIYSVIQVTVIGILIAQLQLLFIDPIASLYMSADTVNKDVVLSETFVIAESVLTFYFLAGIMNVVSGFLRGLGYSTAPMLTSVLGVVVLRFTWIFVFFPMHSDSVAWLYLCFPITWIGTLIMDVFVLIHAYKRVNSMPEKTEQTEVPAPVLK